MTAKRFYNLNLGSSTNRRFLIVDGKPFDKYKSMKLDVPTSVILMNKLAEENERLKKENKKLKYHLNETEKELKEYKDFMSLG